MTSQHLTYAPLIVCAISVCSHRALANDIPAVLAVDRVTVYQEGAMVTRSGTIQIPAGVHRLDIPGLPAGVAEKSLHVAIDSAAVRLGGIEVEQINEGKFVSDAERQLRRKLEQLTDQRTALQDEGATAQLQLKLLESVAGAGAVAGAGTAFKATVDGANLSSVLATMGTSSAVARKHVRDANLQSRDLDRQIETVRADLAKVATTSKQSTRVHASLEAKSSVSAVVTVSYAVATASWRWIYEARLDTVKKRLTLERQGQVQQGTGEDWQNVELTLTTALPSDDVATPLVGSKFVDLLASMPKLQLSASRAALAPAPLADALNEVVVTGGKRDNARLESTEYLADYKIPSRVTLSADREPRLYPIAEDSFDVDLVARVVPSAGRAAHLEATFNYRRDVPLDSSDVQLYRDGAYVGEAVTKTFPPGAEVRMPFGIDERIRVALQDEGGKSAERGVLSKQITRETRQRFDITSFHPMPIAVEVIDRIPVSKHADVNVAVLKGATDPTQKDLDGKVGVYLWRFAAVPQKTVSIRQYYSVEYPKDRQISETDETASE